LRRLIIWAGLLAVSAAPNIAQYTPSSKYTQDPRLARLRQFLEHVGSPIKHLAPDFLDAADCHGLDWRLLPSISVIETGAGREAERNNIFGWDSGRKTFATIREAIYLVASRIGHSKLYRDKELDEILATYNPRPDYAGRVKSVMRQVDSSEPLRARCPVTVLLNPSYALQRTVRLEPAR
jgi:hypothetical protein